MNILYRHKLKKKKIILLQGENGRTLINETLKNQGFKICLIECYKKVSKILDINRELKKWHLYKINTLVATSSEILYQLKNIFSDTNRIEWLLRCKMIVVGERLFTIAQKLGWKDIIVSKYANNKSLLKKIKEINK